MNLNISNSFINLIDFHFAEKSLTPEEKKIIEINGLVNDCLSELDECTDPVERERVLKHVQSRINKFELLSNGKIKVFVDGQPYIINLKIK